MEPGQRNTEYAIRSTSPGLAAAIKARASALGFDMCGIAPAEPSAFKPQFREWLARGYHGEMLYMARDPERRLDPHAVMPDCRSIVVVAMNYYTETDADSDDPERAIFARYARGDDYHEVMTARLRELLAFIEESWSCNHEGTKERSGHEGDQGPHPLTPSPKNRRGGDRARTDAAAQSEIGNPKSKITAAGRIYVDTGPILEREVAQRAGIGWFGKNTMLINTRRGSYFLLGEILLNLPLAPDEPAVGGCGTCTRCIDACPTGAIVRPFELDARRCISYLTIELKGDLPAVLASQIGNRVFGCDICQEVCPFNQRRAAPTAEPAFQPRPATRMPLSELARMTEEEFRVAFNGSPVKRAKWRGLMRNVTAATSACSGPAAGRLSADQALGHL